VVARDLGDAALWCVALHPFPCAYSFDFVPLILTQYVFMLCSNVRCRDGTFAPAAGHYEAERRHFGWCSEFDAVSAWYVPRHLDWVDEDVSRVFGEEFGAE